MKKNIFLLFFTILIAGCSAKDTKEETVAANATQTQESVITLAFVGKTEFQPHSVSEESAQMMLKTIYEPLYNEDDAGAYRPVLAKKLVNYGNLIDVYLKDGVKWHDGTDFSVDDVVYTINLIIEGNSVYKTSAISGVYAKSENCVAVLLSRYVSCPESVLTFPIVKNNSPISMKYPIGTGKYCFKQKEAFDSYVFVPFDDHYASKGHFNKLRMIAAKNREREKGLFMSGETDVLYVNSSELMKYSPRKSSQLLIYPIKHIVYIGFNNKTVPRDVRKRIYYAIDRFELTEKIFSHAAIPASTPSEPARRGKSANDSNLYLSKNVPKSVKQSEYTLAYETDDGCSDLALKLLQILKQAGINCSIIEIEKDKPNKAEFDIFVGTHKPESDFFDMLTANDIIDSQLHEIFKKPHNAVDINNLIINNVPFIVVAYKCNGIALTGSFNVKKALINDLFYYGYDIID